MNNIQKSGNDSIQIIGSKNLIFNFFKTKDSYKVLSEILKEIVKNIDGSVEMDIAKTPTEVLKKIAYNNIPLHKDFYIDSIPYLSKLEFIIETTYGSRSQIVINRIKYNWNKICSLYPNETKDKQLYKLDELLLAKTDPKIIKKYGLDVVEIGIGLIVFYTFTRCQILDNPN